MKYTITAYNEAKLKKTVEGREMFEILGGTTLVCQANDEEQALAKARTMVSREKYFVSAVDATESINGDKEIRDAMLRHLKGGE